MSPYFVIPAKPKRSEGAEPESRFLHVLNFPKRDPGSRAECWRIQVARPG